MSSAFSGFGGSAGDAAAGDDSTTAASSTPAADTAAPTDTAAGEQPAGGAVLTPAADGKPDEQPAPEIVPGVPLWLHGVDGDALGIYWLASLDLDATHEYDQPARHAGIDGDRQVAGIGNPVQKSGGAAYYYNVLTGRGFSVPINPSGG